MTARTPRRREGPWRDRGEAGRSGSETSTDDLLEPLVVVIRAVFVVVSASEQVGVFEPQSHASATAGLILGSVDSRALLSENSDETASFLQERGRDAARGRVVLNTATC